MLRSAAVLAFALALPAQGGPPTFVPKDGALSRFIIEDIPGLMARLPGTALGRLLAEPEVASAFATYLAGLRKRVARGDAVYEAATAMGLDVSLTLDDRLVRRFDAADLVRFEMTAMALVEGNRRPATVCLFSCRPQVEGRQTRLFEEDVALVGKNAHFEVVADAKVGGFPAHVFRPASDAANADPLPPGYGPQATWLAHLPGVFAFGQGLPEDCGAVAPAPARASARVTMTIDLRAYVAMLESVTGRITAEAKALGLDGLDRFEWRATFAGERILDEFELTLADKPAGLVGALLTGTVKLPAQALPDGALLQLRCAIDVRLLCEAMAALAGRAMPWPEAMQKDLLAAFTGGVALGVGAPAKGGMIPRIYLSLGVADGEALTRLIDMAFPGDAAKKQVTYEGVACTVLAVPGLPPAVQPTFCVADGVLHVAESALSMRAFLKARQDGVEAMDVGEAPLPEGPGEVLPTFDLRCDEAAVYRAFHEVWLPLFALLPDTTTGIVPMLRRDDMPSPEAVARHVGKSRGILRKDGQRYTVQHLGALGGPEAAALAMTWGPIVSGSFHQDWGTEDLATNIARHKLETVWPALETYQREKGSWPATLGDLFAAGRLPVDALLVPGDDAAEAVALSAGDSRTVKSSFRYFPKPVKVGDGEMLLIAIAPCRYHRAMLTIDGNVPETWGEESRLAIDKFK